MGDIDGRPVPELDNPALHCDELDGKDTDGNVDGQKQGGMAVV